MNQNPQLNFSPPLNPSPRGFYLSFARSFVAADTHTPLNPSSASPVVPLFHSIESRDPFLVASEVMAAVAPPADQTAELMQKLSLDSQAKAFEFPVATKKPSIDSGNVASGIQSDRSITPILPDFIDPTMCFLPNAYPSAYFIGGYGGSANEWEDNSRYVNQEGLDVTPGVYGENGSLMYNHGYGYAPYGPYSRATTPVPNVGHDGQHYGAHHYPYPPTYFQSLPTSGSFPTPAATAKGENAKSAADDQAPLSVDSTNSKSNGLANSGGAKVNNGSAPARASYQRSSFNSNGTYGRGPLPGGVPASSYQDPIYGYDGLQYPYQWFDATYYSDVQPRPVTSSAMNSSITTGNTVPSSRNQNLRPHMMGFHHPQPISGMNTTNGYMNRLFPNKLFGQYGNAYRSSLGYGASGYDTRSNGRGWMAVDTKYKTRGRGNGFYNYGNESTDGLNELNRGPRSKSFKNLKDFTSAALAVKGQNIPVTATADDEEKVSSAGPDREQYNRPDFPETYSDAKFFIIKSYSEDDVHKSIKYNVWASTPNGNKKLDTAYIDAQQKSGDCPVFLFFSVNTSGQFVGVAEMVGSVDFNKNVEYWQQDKWIGCFPVKWHIVKDVPNSLLKHIILENNENKPVTNSRDTQDVKLEQGLQLLNIFKEHTSKQCILDDFEFYEDRQKRIQGKKAKLQQLQKQAQVWEGKSAADDETKDSTHGDIKPQKSVDPASDISTEAASIQANGETKTSESITSKSGEVNNVSSAAVSEKKLVANGVANGC